MATACLVALAGSAGAQVRPDLPWRTLTTVHFRIHFTPELRELARRTAANAERAWRELEAELPVPRGPVDIVIADNVDYANGYATPFPTNRIVIYARPPVDQMALRNHADWNRSLITHELTHIFQLDRADGVWSVAQAFFGRAAPFFPHAYAPSWMLEGIAVHYETTLAGGGRLDGTEFPAYLRALSAHRDLPALDAARLERPFFPGGQAAYLFGAFAIQDGLQQDTSATERVAMQRLVAAMSRRLIVWRQDANAREAFGTTFTARYAMWADSVRRAGEADPFPVDDSAVRELVPARWTARYPRFLPSGDLIFVADDARRMPGLYRVTPDGATARIGRRNSVDANSPTDDGSTVQAEFERADPYTIRSDLFQGSGLSRQRLTRDERLSHPDVHLESGKIIAVQALAGTTQLVTLTRGFAFPTRFVGGSLDLTWSEPRWSHEGTRVAAVSWERGGRTSVVILDGIGRELRRFSPRGSGLTVVSSPVWVPGDTTVLFVSDHEGRAMIYLGDVRTGAYGRVWATRTALNTPDVNADGTLIAAAELRAAGYRIVTRPMPEPPTLTLPAADLETGPHEEAPSPIVAIETQYVPRRTMRPRWWLPAVNSDDEGQPVLGFLTGGEDVIGRHRWMARGQIEPTNIELHGAGAYTYAGFGNPTITLAAEIDWFHQKIVDQDLDTVGTLAAQSIVLSTSMLAARHRARLTSFVRLGAEFEFQRYRTYPRDLINLLIDDYYRDAHLFPRPFASLGFSTLQRPGLSVSTEDGLAATATYRARLRESVTDGVAHEAILTAQAAKSIPLPGYARHVIAVRVAAGALSGDASTSLSVGGVSGETLEVLPGLILGGGARSFFVRGFEPGAQRGVRAGAASAEYRAPLVRVGRGYRFVPTFLQKTSLIAFADAGAAWCDVAVVDSPSCEAPLSPRTPIASAGGELVLDGTLLAETLYRFRLGFAAPIRGTQFASSPRTFYFTLGSTF